MRAHWMVAAAISLAWTGAALAQTGTSPLMAPLKGPTGADLGSVTLTATPGGVLMRVDAKGLPEGWHGIHFHAKGSCEGPKFESAGGHVHEGTASKHGFMNPDHTDNGDLPNIFAGADGMARADIYSTAVRLDTAASGAPALRGPDGSSVIIHANPDDYTSQPIGGAGARIACALIK